MNSYEMPRYLVKLALNGTNYGAWALGVKTYLSALGLWGHITGESACPPAPLPPPQLPANASKALKDYQRALDSYKQWRTHDARTKLVLLDTVEDSIILSLPTESAQKVWTYLQKRYKHIVEAVHYTSLQQLQALRQYNGRQFFYHGRKANTSEFQTRAQYFFSLKDIESATKYFDPANTIDEGGFGPVYKGTLADGTTVAVKKLSSTSSQGNREFLNERGIISSLRHQNLVRLYGCCIDGDQLLLIYEFLENNSLGCALFGRAEHELKLDWSTRYSICLGTAEGLAYLHEESTLKIVHRDIKPSNILLDEKLRPKISDFGLAKLNDDCGRVRTRIAGTIGYMAPEYATRGCLTSKADVYSYGVVTLEIVSGMSNMNGMSNEECLHLLDWAERLKQQGRLLEIVDRRLGSDYSQEQALRLLNVTLLCTSTIPAQRLRMSSVVKMIRGQIPIEVVPDDDLSEDLRLNTSQPLHSVSNIQTDWSLEPSSSGPSVLQHYSKDIPSSSSSSLKL